MVEKKCFQTVTPCGRSGFCNLGSSQNQQILPHTGDNISNLIHLWGLGFYCDNSTLQDPECLLLGSQLCQCQSCHPPPSSHLVSQDPPKRRATMKNKSCLQPALLALPSPSPCLPAEQDCSPGPGVQGHSSRMDTDNCRMLTKGTKSFYLLSTENVRNWGENTWRAGGCILIRPIFHTEMLLVWEKSALVWPIWIHYYH